jgi:hypothetical protein
MRVARQVAHAAFARPSISKTAGGPLSPLPQGPSVVDLAWTLLLAFLMKRFIFTASVVQNFPVNVNSKFRAPVHGMTQGESALAYESRTFLRVFPATASTIE